MVKFKKKKKGNKSTLIVNGELSIAGAAEFKDTLMKLHENSGHLILDLTNVSSIDTSCLQLLCAVHKSSINSNMTIEIKNELQESFKQSVTDAGYIRKGSCSADFSDSCFWANDE